MIKYHNIIRYHMKINGVKMLLVLVSILIESFPTQWDIDVVQPDSKKYELISCLMCIF